jgi:uncharacterized membrane protein YphA (DoxX/SURF4 family)
MTKMYLKQWNIGLWIAQVLLGVVFSMAGAMKMTTPILELAESMNWVNETPEWLVRFIGVSEVLAGFGLILPSVLRIKPKLTVLAAIGLVIVMVLAMVDHIMLGEYKMIGINISFAILAAFVAWGRSKKVVISEN